LWVVGTDHAGIATQMVVERQLNARQQKRTDFTREEFIAKVWEWKTESGGEITGQLRRLGCSMDWENERFTMDEGFSKAVIKVFVDLYNQKLLYRDKRLVNWDPGLKTAISDLEVETREINGKFWHFKYPLEDGSGFISVATTRPETMLADMAVAVNPSDERYAHIVGKNVRLPITGRLIPIVTDEHADPELGSGAVKITPGHDFNDFEVGKRAGFKASDMFNMLDGEGRVVQTADGLIPAEYIGQYRFGIEGEPTNARKMVVAALDALGLLEKVEDRVIQTPFGDRSGQVIEPWLTDQWYVDAETLAKPAIEAARKGKANGGFDIVPKSWEKTYFNWMENIQPWCVSRQLWWGHQIPAWFAADGTCYVAETEEAAQLLAGAGVALTRDPDVLDTWFSSALWPFGTLGWPDQDTMLDRHYPNDVLISGFDILFFWDARMAMQGIHFMEEVPWKTLYLHGLVRAADGSKMSKSKGNTVDPLGLIDQYGADALRFFMAAMESQGRDIKMDESRVAGYRNFATKLWNAARFAQSNGIGGSRSVSAPKAELAVNRWIIGEVVSTVEKLNKAFAEFRFDGMADVIYHFVFDQFCDWYLELLKPILQAQSGDDGAEPQPSLVNADADEAREVAGWALDQILVMLHPFMPFITEELWHAMSDPAQPRAHDIIHAQWPEPNATIDADAVAEINWVIDTISKTRSFKAELNIPPGTRLTANIADPQVSTMSVIARQVAALSRLGRIDSFVYAPVATNNVAQIVVGGDTVVFALDDVIDLDAERSRITKALEAARKERDALAGRLSNAAFVEKAKPEAVEKARADHAEKAAEAERLTVALARLG
jgi:valyl-tRNA synthetase